MVRGVKSVGVVLVPDTGVPGLVRWAGVKYSSPGAPRLRSCGAIAFALTSSSLAALCWYKTGKSRLVFEMTGVIADFEV